ncbi:MAG: beta-galactosidase [Anaerolineaceae bacterium]
MRLRPLWSDIQPISGTYDWTSVDTILDLAAQHGKFIGLSVTAGVNTPQWVYDKGAIKYKLKDGSGLSMSVPWDTAFLSRWLPFIQAMGNRYDGNPNLRYIVISGLGQYIETYLSKSAADDTALGALGGQAAWVASAQQIIAAYADAFPTTPFFITAGRPFFSIDSVASLQTVIDWAVANYPGRFGIMNATLNGVSDTGYYPNLAIYTYHGTQPVGFQMLCSSITDRVRLKGTLDQAFVQGIGLGANFVEVYQNDADAAFNQSVLAKRGTNLKANVPPVGK